MIPAWGDQPFVEIGRGEIAKLLDAVEDKHGPWVADSVLSALRAVAGWYAGRHNSYQLPFVRGMRRVKAKDRKRERILSDDELHAFWHTAENARTFGALLRLLLLTAQRRDKVATMKWSEPLAGRRMDDCDGAGREGQSREPAAAVHGARHHS